MVRLLLHVETLGVSPLFINLNGSRCHTSTVKILFGFAAFIGLSMTAQAQTYYYPTSVPMAAPAGTPVATAAPVSYYQGTMGNQVVWYTYTPQSYQVTYAPQTTQYYQPTYQTQAAQVATVTQAAPTSNATQSSADRRGDRGV